MFYIRVVKGPEKRHARDVRILINGVEYRTNEVGAIRCSLPAGEHEVMVGDKIHKINPLENDTSIVEME